MVLQSKRMRSEMLFRRRTDLQVPATLAMCVAFQVHHNATSGLVRLRILVIVLTGHGVCRACTWHTPGFREFPGMPIHREWRQ